MSLKDPTVLPPYVITTHIVSSHCFRVLCVWSCSVWSWTSSNRRRNFCPWWRGCSLRTAPNAPPCLTLMRSSPPPPSAGARRSPRNTLAGNSGSSSHGHFRFFVCWGFAVFNRITVAVWFEWKSRQGKSRDRSRWIGLIDRFMAPPLERISRRK